MSDHLERAEEARERVAGLEYEERWNEDRYDRDERIVAFREDGSARVESDEEPADWRERS